MSRPVANVYREDKDDSVYFDEMESQVETGCSLDSRDVKERGSSPVASVAVPCEAHCKAVTANAMPLVFREF